MKMHVDCDRFMLQYYPCSNASTESIKVILIVLRHFILEAELFSLF